jgi:hypothetical protein
VFAGTVKRPDISALKFDLHESDLLLDFAEPARATALLRVVLGALKAGFG